MEDWREVKILSCRSGEIFAKRICEHLEKKYDWKKISSAYDLIYRKIYESKKN